MTGSLRKVSLRLAELFPLYVLSEYYQYSVYSSSLPGRPDILHGRLH